MNLIILIISFIQESFQSFNKKRLIKFNDKTVKRQLII